MPNVVEPDRRVSWSCYSRVDGEKIRRIGPLRKLAQRGFRGYPVATVTFYGPDDQRASKVAVGIVLGEDEDPDVLERWFSDSTDVRRDPAIVTEIVQVIKDNSAKSVGVYDGIIGCPHEEGVDYPEGESCPQCPYWQGRNRFTGKFESEDDLALTMQKSLSGTLAVASGYAPIGRHLRPIAKISMLCTPIYTS